MTAARAGANVTGLDLAPALLRLLATTANTKHVLVHGDVSPKNILCGPAGPVFLDAECAWWGDEADGFAARVETPQAWKVSREDIAARNYNLDIKNPHTVADDHGDPEVLLESLTAAEAQTANLRNQLKAILAEALAR